MGEVQVQQETGVEVAAGRVRWQGVARHLTGIAGIGIASGLAIGVLARLLMRGSFLL